MYLLGHGGLPNGESARAVGQWGPWVGVLLVLIASAVKKHKSTRQKIRQDPLLDAQIKPADVAFASSTGGNSNTTIATLPSSVDPRDAANDIGINIAVEHDNAALSNIRRVRSDTDLEAARVMFKLKRLNYKST